MTLHNFLILLIVILFLITISCVLFVVLLRVSSQRYEAKRNVFISKWENEFFDYIYGDSNPSELIDKIPVRHYKYLFDFLKPLFLNLKGEDFVRLSKIISDTVLYDHLTGRLNKKINNIFKIESAYFLGLARLKHSAQLLEKQISSPNELVFVTTATALARMNSIKHAGIIIDESKKFKDLASDSLYAILAEFSNNVSPYLIERLETENARRKEVLIAVLRHFRYYNAGPAILQELTNTREKGVLTECLRFIREVEYANAANAVKRFLYHPKGEVREEAVKTYAKITPQENEGRIVEKVYDTDWTVQLAAAEALYDETSHGEEMLEKIAYNLKNKKAAAAARMVLSEKTLFE